MDEFFWGLLLGGVGGVILMGGVVWAVCLPDIRRTR